MAAPTLVALGAIVPSKVNILTYTRVQGTHTFAAASYTGCISTPRNWGVKTSKFTTPQVSLALYLQPAVGCMCITTTALKERLTEPLYRKRRKKGRGRGAQASARPVVAVPEEKLGVLGKSVVVVESPAKARTIEKYLGEGHVVLPSFGHVRDLAAKSGSVRPDEDFKLVWEVPSSARQHLNAIKAAIKGKDNLVLASDPDREGEAIAWHVLEMLKTEGAVNSNLKVRRVVFNEITKAAVLRAMQAPRDISATLVDAYLARRALDYLIGFDLSPLLWRKLPGSKSAGRVQSAALRLICEREVEMETFISREYWTVEAEVSLSDKDNQSSTSSDDYPAQRRKILAKVTHVDGEKLSQFALASDKQARAVTQRVQMSRLSVCSVKKSFVRRNPPAPYITSTLQQDASSKLAFGASRTMALAQQLYEGVKLEDDELTGLITYMRTDGVQLSSEAVQNIRALIAERYGNEFTPQQPRQFTSRVKNAQEAHEAIRPTDIKRLPSMLVNILEQDALRLYSLIWCRTIACQMERAIFAQVAVGIMNDTEDVQLRASGSSVSFPGFLAAFKSPFEVPPDKLARCDGFHEDAMCGQDKVALPVTTEDDTEEGGDVQTEGEDLRSLEGPARVLARKMFMRSTSAVFFEILHLNRMKTSKDLPDGDLVSLNNVQPNQHHTEAPPRYSEGSLVKKMEELGIGRPSTYASTLKVLQSRNYVKTEKRRIFPEGRGRMVSAFLSHYFPRFSNYEFTAKLETQLDDVSAGRAQWKQVLADFWPDFHEGVTAVLKTPFEEVVNLLEDVFAEQFFSGSTERVCPRYKTNVLSADGADSSDEEESAPQTDSPAKRIGVDPSSGLEVVLKIGPYGKYLQIGSLSKKQKPKRTAVPKDMNADEIELDAALELLKYPFELGRHPETKSPILISIGQYGPFLRCKGVFVSIPKDSISSLTVEQAVALLQSKHVSRRGRKGKAQDETPSEDAPDRNNVQQKASKAPAPRAKGSSPASAKKLTSAGSGSVEKGKRKMSEKRKKSDKLAGERKEKLPVKGVEKGKENGAEGVKKGPGRPQKVSNAGEPSLVKVKSR